MGRPLITTDSAYPFHLYDLHNCRNLSISLLPMRYLCLVTCMVLPFFTTAQINMSGSGTEIKDIYDVSGRPLVTLNNTPVVGSPLFADSWATGTVTFASGRYITNALLRYNVYSNELSYKVGDLVFRFLDQVQSFQLNYVDDTGSDTFQFRNGYPATGKRGSAVFYEVLATGGRYQLLKHHFKVLKDYYEYGSAPTKAYRDGTELWLYDGKTQGMTQVRNIHELAKQMPDLAALLIKQPLRRSGPAMEKVVAAFINRLE